MHLSKEAGITCENPNQASSTMKAAGSKIEVFLPNMTDWLAGGPGLPYLKMGEGHLVRDAHFAPGGGRAEIRQVVRFALNLPDVLANSAAASMKGYTPQYVKTSIRVESSLTLFGLPMGSEAVHEEWCGSYGGSCMARTLDGNGNPTVPAQLEPALCGLTRAVCGTEADMKAAMSFEALGGMVAGAAPCRPETGLPSSAMCNAVTSPGVDPATLLPRTIDPPKELTAQAQSDQDKKTEEGEAMVNMFLVGAIAVNAASSVFYAALSVLNYRRRRARKQAEAGHPAAAAGAPTILAGSAGAKPGAPTAGKACAPDSLQRGEGEGVAAV